MQQVKKEVAKFELVLDHLHNKYKEIHHLSEELVAK